MMMIAVERQQTSKVISIDDNPSLRVQLSFRSPLLYSGECHSIAAR